MDLALFDQDMKNRSATSGGFTSSRSCTLVAFTNTAESYKGVDLSSKFEDFWPILEDQWGIRQSVSCISKRCGERVRLA
jgi:hypothetical protein